MAIMINTFREGYGIDQVKRTMTVGELINFLQDFDEDEPIYLGFDNQYTVGGLTEGMFEEPEDEVEDDYYKDGE